MIDQPPAIYQHCAIPVVIDDHFGGELTAWNGPCFPWLGSYACAKVINGVGYIYAIKGKLTPELKAHEIGHICGWPADHPQ